MSDLCVFMKDVISEFNSEIVGSHAYFVLMLFLCSILCLMCSGNSLIVWVVLQVVRLYNVVMSGVCCSVVCGTLVGVSVFNLICSELLTMPQIS